MLISQPNTKNIDLNQIVILTQAVVDGAALKLVVEVVIVVDEEMEMVVAHFVTTVNVWVMWQRRASNVLDVLLEDTLRTLQHLKPFML